MTSDEKRDQRAYDLVKGRLSGLILNTMVRIVGGLDAPYVNRPGIGGPRGHPPRAMAVACMIRDAERKTFHGAASYLRAHRDVAEKIGFGPGGTPGAGTINDAHARMPESYFYEVHKRAVPGPERGRVHAGDATGIAERRSDRRVDFRTDRARRRKGWIKLHAVIDAGSRVTTDYFVTRSRVSDIAGMRTLPDRFGTCLDADGNMDFCPDSAYLAREMCNRLAGMGFAPYIKPKKNTSHNTRGSRSWRVMADPYNDDLPEFKRHCHRRSITEAVFGAIKTMYGSYVTCRREDNRRREMAARIICYNIELIARHDVRGGRLTRQSLEAVAA